MKFAYCTTITKDDYIPCIILNKRLLDYFNSKYPFVVLVGNEVSQKGIEWLKEFNIIVKEVPTFQIQSKNSLTPLCVMHFSSLSLIEYDYVLSFEADILFLENPDFYFNYYKEIKEHHNFYFENEDWSNIYKNKVFYTLQKTQFYLCKPNLTVYNELKKYANLDLPLKLTTDHDLIKIFYFNQKNTKMKINSINYIHFPGCYKFWDVFKDKVSFINDYFFNKTKPIDFFIQKITDDNHDAGEVLYSFAEHYAACCREIKLLDSYFNEKE